MVRKAHARKASDPVERELQERVAAEGVGVGEDERGLMPGEVRTRDQLEAIDKGDENNRNAAGVGEGGTDGKTVVMVREGGIEIDVAERDVEAHKRQGFILRDEPAPEAVEAPAEE